MILIGGGGEAHTDAGPVPVMHGGGRRYVDEKSGVRREQNVWNRDFVLIADGVVMNC